MTATQSSRYSFLDSSRGLAALIVLLSHFQLTILPGLNDSIIFKTPLRIFIDGTSAILYFFILSGYVLTLSLKNSSEVTLTGYLKFIVARIFRIYPAYIFTLLITFVVLNFFITKPDGNWLTQYWQSAADFKSLLTQSLLIVRIPYDPVMRLIPQDWTLTIEIAISFLLPVLAAAFVKRSFVALIFVYGAVMFLRLEPFVFDFSLGIFLARNRDWLIDKWKNPGLKIPLIFLASLMICSGYLFPEQMKYADLILIHHKSWGIVIILWAIISSEKIQLVLSRKPLVFLGQSSYSFYLLHLLILLILTSVLNDLNPFLFLIVYLIITIVTSSIIFKIIEQRFNRFSRQFFSKIPQ